MYVLTVANKAFRLGTWSKNLRKSASPTSPKGDWTDDAYRLGAFTHPDPKVRRQAIDLTKRGLDSLAVAGGRLMTLWMGQDGFDYSFQVDYRRL